MVNCGALWKRYPRLWAYKPDRFGILVGMMHLLGSLLVLMGSMMAVPAFAADEFSVPTPYAPLVLEEGQVDGSLWLGELNGYPHLYAFTVSGTTTVRVELRSVDMNGDELPLFAGILVRDQESTGVQEVARLGRTDQWDPERSSRTKMQYLVREPFETSVSPGEYRFEVSTPDNQGRYVLQFGLGDAEAGYFAALGDIRQIQAFHGYGWWHIFRTTHVYLPFLLIIIMLGMAATWYYARRRKLL